MPSLQNAATVQPSRMEQSNENTRPILFSPYVLGSQYRQPRWFLLAMCALGIDEEIGFSKITEGKAFSECVVNLFWYWNCKDPVEQA
jgi:hypothetical protein